ncbi:MAG TPA: HD domain-containing phosphohydrolase [Myxococcales bacterium]
MNAAFVGTTQGRRQDLGQRVVHALFGKGDAALDELQSAIVALLESDGGLDVRFVDDGIYLNGQKLELEQGEQHALELRHRGIFGLHAAVSPPRSDLRELSRLLASKSQERVGIRGDARRPLSALRLRVTAKETAADAAADKGARLVSAYAHAVFFVDHTIQQLRVAGELIGSAAASHAIRDLVELEEERPRQFLQLARVKATSDEYWGHHAANVAVLGIGFGARLGLSKARRHELGMAALFHDVGMAAIPSALLERGGKLDARAQVALKASPLFAARAILRDRELHPAALERALAVYECHLDLVPQEGAVPDIGLPGRILAICESYDALTTARPFRPAHTHNQALRIMTTEQVFRFDPHLLDLFTKVVEPLVR